MLAAGVAVGLAALAGFSLAPAPDPVAWIVEIQRDVGYVLALALIISVRFFWVGTKWPRSLLIHTGVMIGWFAFVAMVWLAAAFEREWRPSASGISNWGRVCLLAIWAIWMRPDESTPKPIDLARARVEEDAIARDLQAPPPSP